MKKAIIFTSLFLSLAGFRANAQLTEDPIFHYSVMDAMRNGIYEGEITIGNLMKKGNFGIGTYNYLDGELIALDGVYYRIGVNGKVEKAAPTRKSPFNSVTFFHADKTIEMAGGQPVEAFLEALRKQLPSLNQPYAVRIECEFDEINVGGANKVAQNDTTGLAILMKSRPIYNGKKVRGTLVGFYSPAYAGSIDLSPFHFHFISRDKTYAGHLVSGTLSKSKVKVMLDEKTGYQLSFPQSVKRFNSPWVQETEAKSTY